MFLYHFIFYVWLPYGVIINKK